MVLEQQVEQVVRALVQEALVVIYKQQEVPEVQQEVEVEVQLVLEVQHLRHQVQQAPLYQEIQVKSVNRILLWN